MKILLTGFEPFLQHSVNPSRELVKVFPFSFPENVELQRLILPVSVPESFEELKIGFSSKSLISNSIESPDILIMLGLASERKSISLEKFALNYLWSSAPDNNGKNFSPQEILANEPLALATGFSLEQVLESYMGDRARANSGADFGSDSDGTYRTDSDTTSDGTSGASSGASSGGRYLGKFSECNETENPSLEDLIRRKQENQNHNLSPRISLSAGSYVCNYLYYRALHKWGKLISRRILFIHLPSFEFESFESQGVQLNRLILSLIEDSLSGS